MTSDATANRIQTICLVVLATVAVAGALFWLSDVLIPFVVAVFLAIGLTPLVELQMRRLRFPRILAVVLTLLLGLVIVVGMSLVVAGSVGELTANIGAYQDRLSRLGTEALDALPLQSLGLDRADVRDAFAKVPVAKVGKVVADVTTLSLDIGSKMALVLVFACFLLFGGARHVVKAQGVRGEVQRRIQRYIVVKALVSAVTGFLTGLILWILGVKMAMVFGVLAMLLNFIPNFGSIVATLLPLPLVILSDELSTLAAVLAIALPGAIQFMVGNVIEPRAMGKSMGLHPIVVLLALIVWGMLWGVMGMFLAVPITAVIKILLDRSEFAAPIAALMEGRIDGVGDFAS